MQTQYAKKNKAFKRKHKHKELLQMQTQSAKIMKLSQKNKKNTMGETLYSNHP